MLIGVVRPLQLEEFWPPVRQHLKRRWLVAERAQTIDFCIGVRVGS